MVDALAGTGRGLPKGGRGPAPTRRLREVTANSSGSLEHIVPMIVAAMTVVVMVLLVHRLSLLWTWSETYSGTGSFEVGQCQPSGGLGADQWYCAGDLHSLGATEGTESVLISSKGAYASVNPSLGSQKEVFFDPNSPALVYPQSGRLAEVARLYFSLLPRLFLAVGGLLWLCGRYGSESWFPVRSMRYTANGWRRRGIGWMLAGIGVALANWIVIHKVIGSLAIA